MITWLTLISSLFPYTTLFRSKLAWPWSASEMESTPLVDRWPATTPTSSVTAPMETPPISAEAQMPELESVTLRVAEPLDETEVKLSVCDWHAPRYRIAVRVYS